MTNPLAKLMGMAFHATPILRGMLRDGTLSGHSARVAIMGFARYAAAIAGGNVADDETQAARVAKCGACALKRTRTIAGAGKFKGGTAWHCGTPFVDRVSSGGGCGCLVALQVRGHTMNDPQAAGKSEVGSEKCPKGYW
jgi:hypothetical protein